MPHDRNSRPLKVGDVVNVPCQVTQLQEGTEYCNVTVQTLEPMFPSTSPSTITLNSRQVELPGEPPAPAPGLTTNV